MYATVKKNRKRFFDLKLSPVLEHSLVQTEDITLHHRKVVSERLREVKDLSHYLEKERIMSSALCPDYEKERFCIKGTACRLIHDYNHKRTMQELNIALDRLQGGIYRCHCKLMNLEPGMEYGGNCSQSYLTPSSSLSNFPNLTHLHDQVDLNTRAQKYVDKPFDCTKGKKNDSPSPNQINSGSDYSHEDE
ncbi:MAG: 22 kDa unknown protein [Leveillula taurica associated rhabdo-like virus 1]|nr:MAG: 22 kDa unknown protein [Leveillula taurica associated rhabdo-like virus 1]